ncbi:nuclear transport factor 2 family protein, partial [Burkholderia thailandensis]|uniref:nuclear transport factor 2 family protein n=1 Tax=Burkholderia thailandensis TaxID=57975 RepID=UPI00217D756E
TCFNTSRRGVTLRGAPAVIDVFDQLNRFMPDIHWRLVSAPVAEAEGVAFEWRVSGTVAAPPGASEAATPRAIDVRGATVLKVEGGRIVYLADYYNGLTMYEQMGQAPDVKPLR